MPIWIKEHEYESASPLLDMAMERMHRENNNAAFRDMVCTFAAEASNPKLELYTPVNRSEKDKTIAFRFKNWVVYPFYTEEEMAKICAAEVLGVEMMHYAGSRTIPLGRLFGAGMNDALFVFNFGLPSEIIIPTDIQHTVYHLMLVKALGMKEPSGSSWAEWYDIFQQFLAAGKDKAPQSKLRRVPEMKLEIPPNMVPV